MIYLHKNGVTVVAKKTAKVGHWYMLNGEEYLVVDRKILEGLVSKGKDVTKVVTTKVKMMLRLFSNKNSFNQNIGSWDVSNVESMAYMFYNAKKFNQDLSNWDTSKVFQMESMFEGAKSFNSKIEKWNTKSCRSFRNMFSEAYSFNQPIGTWSVQGNISGMFKNAKSFNQSINDWDVKGVDSMISLFEGAESFNKDLNSWKLPNGYWQGFSLNKMFKNALKFNGNIASWEFKDETRMDEMFCGATSFNQDISNWDMGNVVKMDRMFNKAISFNHDLSSWNINEKLKQKPPSGIFTGAQKMKPEFNPFNKTKRIIDKTYLKLSNVDKNTITKIKKLFTSRDIEKIDLAVELILSLNNYELFKFLLGGCKLETFQTDDNKVGDLDYFNSILHTNKFFTGTGPSQPFLNYALMSIVSNLPQDQNIEVDESLYIKNISRLNLSTLLEDSYSHKKFVSGCFNLSKFAFLRFLIVDFKCFENDFPYSLNFDNKNVEGLIMDSAVGSLSWLSKFSKLKKLKLKNYPFYPFKDFEVFHSLNNLEDLEIKSSGYTNINFLKNCTKIKSLKLDFSLYSSNDDLKLEDPSELENLKNLKYFELVGINKKEVINDVFKHITKLNFLDSLNISTDDQTNFYIKVDLKSFHGLKNHFSLKKVKINNLELLPFKTTLFN
jgi:surface protein